MPAIPIFSASPINAAKASGATPQTAGSGSTPTSSNPSRTTDPPIAQQQSNYSTAKPGSVPSLPVQTGAAVQPPQGVRPTPTQTAEDDTNPLPPQPGAAPVPPSGGSPLPPPPKAGEKLPELPLQTSQVPMPPQMSYPAPTSTSQAYSSTSANPYLGSYPQPTSLREGGLGDSSHPPGYQQNVNASKFDSHQRAAHNAYVSHNSQGTSLTGAGDEGGVWDTAKKWASAAGDSLVAAENEVWKRINKD